MPRARGRPHTLAVCSPNFETARTVRVRQRMRKQYRRVHYVAIRTVLSTVFSHRRKNGQVRIPPEPAPARESTPEPAPARESAPEPAPACESAPEPIPTRPEAFPEPAVGPEVIPEVLEPNTLPVSPVMAKRAVFAFYVLAVLRAWRTHLSSFDQGPVCQPEPAAVPEQPEPATSPKAVPEPPALPDMVNEPPWSALPAPPMFQAPPPDLPKPTWSVPPGLQTCRSPPGQFLQHRPGTQPGRQTCRSTPGPFLQHCPGTQPGLQTCLSPPGPFLQYRPVGMGNISHAIVTRISSVKLDP
ncbi:hypothetical protein DPX16_9157 [Anabarilius grahami]|uniref:Uncharacterized protein n=1 Tax=Anabarilius grahami TaxID=495550 RepID=A0A3N0Y1I0_ANAGA|nr:hypothetical protein DPX16_9157 [Anabarilius grahami]